MERESSSVIESTLAIPPSSSQPECELWSSAAAISAASDAVGASTRQGRVETGTGRSGVPWKLRISEIGRLALIVSGGGTRPTVGAQRRQVRTSVKSNDLGVGALTGKNRDSVECKCD